MLALGLATVAGPAGAAPLATSAPTTPKRPVGEDLVCVGVGVGGSGVLGGVEDGAFSRRSPLRWRAPKSGDTVSVGAGTFNGDVTIATNVTLRGAGADKTTISTPSLYLTNEITVAPEVDAFVENLTVSGANPSGPINHGIVATTGSLTLEKDAVVDTLETTEPRAP